MHFLSFKLVWVFLVGYGIIQKVFCLPGVDHRHTNAKNAFVSLEFSVVGAI